MRWNYYVSIPHLRVYAAPVAVNPWILLMLGFFFVISVFDVALTVAWFLIYAASILLH